MTIHQMKCPGCGEQLDVFVEFPDPQPEDGHEAVINIKDWDVQPHPPDKPQGD